VSLKGRLRRLDAGVRWLETEGRYRRIETMMKVVDMLQKIADRSAADPAFAARWKKDFPNFPYKLPPPAAPVQPRDSEPVEAAPRVGVILREAPLQGTLQDEAVRMVAEPSPQPAPPHPEERVARLEPGQPTSPRSPDMEIRPVQWRARGAQDDDADDGETYGRCLTEYDPLRDEYDDDGYD
jgi:hypothetical protein